MSLGSLRRPASLLLFATLLAGCSAAGGGGTAFTEEARCQREGGVWRADHCDASGAGGGGY